MWCPFRLGGRGVPCVTRRSAAGGRSVPPVGGAIRMSDTSQGVGWWLAWDGKWYPPESRPVSPAPSAPAIPNGDEGGASDVATDGGGVQPTTKTKARPKVRTPHRRARPQATPAATVTP